MLDIEPKNIKTEIRQQRLMKFFTILIFFFSVLLIYSEYQKMGEWSLRFITIAVICAFWNYKLDREIKTLKEKLADKSSIAN